MNCIYKHLATAAGKDTVSVGDVLTLRIDLAFTHDGNGPATAFEYDRAGHSSVFCADRIMFCFDHGLPAPTVSSREGHNLVRDLARKTGAKLYDKGEGVVHQVVLEQAAPRRGSILVGADGHVCTAGSYGALAFSVKPAELAQSMHDGAYTIVVPPVVSIVVDGDINLPLMAKDVILFLMGKFGTEGLKGKAVVFAGSAIVNANLSDRMTICNMASEAGAVTAYVPELGEVIGDVEESYCYHISDIPLSVACPPNPGAVRPLHELVGTQVDQVIIGACSSGRLEDMSVVAAVLENATVNPDTTLVVVPASRMIADEMDRLGWSAIIRRSGGILVNPGCGPCSGTHQGVLANGERVVSTTTRNTAGRIGDKGAEIYLASPLVAVAAAVNGHFAEPATVQPKPF